jgi:hypothetical protein
MKSIATPLLPGLVLGVIVGVLALGDVGHSNFGVLQWSLAIVLVLLGVWICAMLVNFAIFAPVYWLLGRIQSKKAKACAVQSLDA